jgi:hypothetical protein
MSIIENGFETKDMPYLGNCYQCKLCSAIFKTSFDALMHMTEYHRVYTSEQLSERMLLKETISQIVKERDEYERESRQEQRQDRIVIKKVLKPKGNTLLRYINITQ